MNLTKVAAIGVMVTCALFAVTLRASSQTNPTKIDGVSEPPELTGEPKKRVEATPTERQLFEIVGPLKTPDETMTAMPELNKFIDEHSDYSDAYFLRAYCDACILNSRDWASITSDVESATSHGGANIYNKTDYYSLLSKVAMAEGQYGQAMDGLEKAMSQDLSTADRMFNIEGSWPC